MFHGRLLSVLRYCSAGHAYQRRSVHKMHATDCGGHHRSGSRVVLWPSRRRVPSASPLHPSTSISLACVNSGRAADRTWVDELWQQTCANHDGCLGLGRHRRHCLKLSTCACATQTLGTDYSSIVALFLAIARRVLSSHSFERDGSPLRIERPIWTCFFP